MSSAQDVGTPRVLTKEPEEGLAERQEVQEEDQREEHQGSSVGTESRPQRQPQPEPQPRYEPQTELEPQKEVAPPQEIEPQQRVEPVASTSFSQVPDQPPQTPPKDRDSEGRLSVDPTFFVGFSHVDRYYSSTGPNPTGVRTVNRVEHQHAT